MPSTKSTFRAQIVQCTPRATLDLSEQHVTDQDTPFIAIEAIVKKGCKDLYLKGNEITAKGVLYLADAIQYNSALETLALSSNYIGDKGAMLLSTALMTDMSRLKELDLSANNITDEGMKYLAQMLERLTSLTHLWLDNNDIGNPRIRALAASATDNYSTKVKNVSLTGNKYVSDASIRDLAKVIGCWRLTTLHLRYCSLSERAKEELRSKLSQQLSTSTCVLFM